MDILFSILTFLFGFLVGLKIFSKEVHDLRTDYEQLLKDVKEQNEALKIEFVRCKNERS